MSRTLHKESTCIFDCHTRPSIIDSASAGVQPVLAVCIMGWFYLLRKAHAAFGKSAPAPGAIDGDGGGPDIMQQCFCLIAKFWSCARWTRCSVVRNTAQLARLCFSSCLISRVETCCGMAMWKHSIAELCAYIYRREAIQCRAATNCPFECHGIAAISC